MAMACDGEIAEAEIKEIKFIVANEIYFMDYDFEEPLNNNLVNIKTNREVSIKNYLQEIESNHLSEHQEILLIEVLLRVIESDKDIRESELEFLQMVKSKLKVDQHILIEKFPKHIGHLFNFKSIQLDQERSL